MVTVGCQLEAQAVEKMVLLAVSVYVILLSPNLWSTVCYRMVIVVSKDLSLCTNFLVFQLGKVLMNVDIIIEVHVTLVGIG